MAPRGIGAKLRYRSDEFLSGGAGKQLLFLFGLTVTVVVVFTLIAFVIHLHEDEGVPDTAWFYFTRMLDAGTMADEAAPGDRVVSTICTILGVVVAGLLISSLAGNFQERLDAIKRGGSAVIESGHFLILGWSEKVYSVIDQISEAYLKQGRIVAVVMADRDKLEMEAMLRDKVVHQDRVKLVVRSGSSVSLTDLSRVSFERAKAIVVLVDENDAGDANRADGRIIKTLMALYNHPDGRGHMDRARVTAEVVSSANQEIAEIASGGKAQVIKTNEIISKVLLQTSRISGLSLVYDELLRFEGNEVHYAAFPESVGKRFDELLLDFPNGCLIGTAKADGSSHQLNPPGDYVVQADEELLILAEDDDIPFKKYAGKHTLETARKPAMVGGEKSKEHLLVLGWNSKVFPILSEFDSYVGPGSTVTLVNGMPSEERDALISELCGPTKNVEIRHLVGEFTSRAVMNRLQPQNYPTVMVLGDTIGGADAEDADTRAIIALLLMRDFRQRHGVDKQEVCSEILNPKNRALAATTEIHDIVISNEMVSMVLAQITYEPRVRAVLEDFFRSEGSEIYLKDMTWYAPEGKPVTFEELILTAKLRSELAMGYQLYVDDPEKRYGMVLNPTNRTETVVPKTTSSSST